MLHPFESAVRDGIVRNRLVDGAGGAVLAVSGGPDSMALLHAMLCASRELGGGLRFVVAHFDHGLRGDESREDARFVASAAERLGLDYVEGRESIADEARARRRNLEAVGRERRYAFLLETAAERGLTRVATGHTASDQAETVLMRLARGAGVDGLSAVAPSRPLDGEVLLVRPLLDITREEVLAYCAAREIPFRVDASNEDTNFTRAFVRAEILPRLERAAPGATASLARTAALAADDRAYFAALVEKLLETWGVGDESPVRLPALELAALHPALRRRVLREAVRRARGDLKRLTAAHVFALERLVERTGGATELPRGVRARREGSMLIVDCLDLNTG